MAATLEVHHSLHGRGPYVTLDPDGGPYVIGRSSACDVAIDDDDAVSRNHLCIELKKAVWSVTDLDARNGTKINGDPLVGPHVLRHQDELTFGRHTKVVFLDAASRDGGTTNVVEPVPVVKGRPRDVLVELLRPMYEGGGAFTAPSSVQTMAAALFIGEGAVKNNLAVLYEKYDVPPKEESGEERRLYLARIAYHRGPVSAKDYAKGAE